MYSNQFLCAQESAEVEVIRGVVLLGEKSYEENLQLVESLRVKERSWSCKSRHQNLASTFWRCLWGVGQKASVNREENEKRSEETIDVGGGSA